MRGERREIWAGLLVVLLFVFVCGCGEEPTEKEDGWIGFSSVDLDFLGEINVMLDGEFVATILEGKDQFGCEESSGIGLALPDGGTWTVQASSANGFEWYMTVESRGGACSMAEFSVANTTSALWAYMVFDEKLLPLTLEVEGVNRAVATKTVTEVEYDVLTEKLFYDRKWVRHRLGELAREERVALVPLPEGFYQTSVHFGDGHSETTGRNFTQSSTTLSFTSSGQ